MPSSIAASSRGSARRVLFAALAVLAIALAGREIVRQWGEFRASGAHLRLRPALLALSGACVLVAWAILIETWRRVVMAWGSRLEIGAAARIWFISNLGRYVPGKVWQVGAMAVMARDAGASPVAATGSAILVNVVNLLAGFAVVAATGASLFDRPALSWGLGTALALALLALPALLPPLGRLAARVTGREVAMPRVRATTVLAAAAGCTAAWVLYGAAFQLLAAGVTGTAAGHTAAWIAAFTGSYLLGYIALFSPGGLGVREGFLIVALQRLGLALVGGAGVIALASRLWLTVLEVLPGLSLLAYDAVRRGPRPTRPP